MDEGNIVPLYFAAPLAICLLLREIWWRNRLKNWVKSEGEVIGCAQVGVDDDRVSCPMILYNFNGVEREQICEFNLCHYKVGRTVPIIINPSSGEIFVTTFQDRWFLSAFLLACVVALLLLANASK